jgi:hypothetical protein
LKIEDCFIELSSEAKASGCAGKVSESKSICALFASGEKKAHFFHSKDAKSFPDWIWF